MSAVVGIRGWGARLTVAAVSVCLYAAAVAVTVRRAEWRADLRGCVELHAAVYQVLLAAGLALGLAAGTAVAPWTAAAARSLLPGAADGRRTAFVRAAALVVIALCLAANALWTNPAVNLFIDGHRAVLVETDVLLYGMGAAAGAAWFLLLDRYGWLGALLMPAMAFMLVGAAFTGSGWC